MHIVYIRGKLSARIGRVRPAVEKQKEKEKSRQLHMTSLLRILS